MAWEEWEQLKGEALDRRSASMQLNQLAPDGGGGAAPHGDLAASQADLKSVGDAANGLYKDFDQFSDLARVSSMAAAGGLRSEGFLIGGALDHVAERWVDQVRSLLDACTHIYTHLDFTQATHAEDEVRVYGAISSIAALDKGFDENPKNEK